MMPVIWIACHTGAADHFATFAETLEARGYAVHIYAAGPAYKKLCERNLTRLTTPFTIDKNAEQEMARTLASECKNASVVITDVGDPFDISLQHALAEHAQDTKRLAYYDNPEDNVPGGYSLVADKVMRSAQGVLFANANLAPQTAPETGIGYYPMVPAARLKTLRAHDKEVLRAKVFAEKGLVDTGQKIWVYIGGNNEEYFAKAFPAFLSHLDEASRIQDLSSHIILLQQHPGARRENRDVALLQKSPIHVSDLTTEEALTLCDGVFYYQTSMGPQFILAGIPSVQVGHAVYPDILVRNNLCATATDPHSLIDALSWEQVSGEEAIEQGLGLRADWADRLETAVAGN